MNMSNVLAKISIVILLLACLVSGAIYAALVTGTNGDNDKTGTAIADTIDLHGGNDRGTGLAGKDTIYGRTGNDILNGGPGVDALYGHDNSDHLLAQPNGSTAASEDAWNCGAGEDFLYEAPGFNAPAARVSGCEHVAEGSLPFYPIQDPDEDLYPNDGAFADNCPGTFNPPQTDTDEQYDDDARGDACDPDNDTPQATSRVNVTDYGATPNDSGNDTNGFEQAMAAAGAGEETYVPAGVYRVDAVSIPSDTDLAIQNTATIKKYGTGDGQLFSMQGVKDFSFAHDINVYGVGGRFVVDIEDAGNNTTPFRLRSVKNFSIKHADFLNNNTDTSGGPSVTLKPDISFLPMDTTKLGGEWEHPIGGTIEDVRAFDSTYGWGLTQLTGAENVHFQDLYGTGGSVLRLENYENNATTINNVTADNVTGEYCHNAVMFNPHDAMDGAVEVTDVTADSCWQAVSLGDDPAYPNAEYASVTIDRVTATYGNTAQRPNGRPAWSVGQADYCVDADPNLTYAANVSVTNLSCGAWLTNRNWPQ
jgi:hypothetical protein